MTIIKSLGLYIFSSLWILLFAGELSLQTLADGACWYEEGDFLKVASFNDKMAMKMGREELEKELERIFYNGKKVKKITLDELSLHCGAYGASLVLKLELEKRPICFWGKFNGGKLQIRSYGGIESKKNQVCDGYRWGELIVGIKNLEQQKKLESTHFQSSIKSVTKISEDTFKIILADFYFGKEAEFVEELKKELDLKYIELNLYQHPIGESVLLNIK